MYPDVADKLPFDPAVVAFVSVIAVMVIFLASLRRPAAPVYVFAFLVFSQIPNYGLIGEFTVQKLLVGLTFAAVLIRPRELFQGRAFVMTSTFTLQIVFLAMVLVSLVLTRGDRTLMVYILNTLVILALLGTLIRSAEQIRALLLSVFFGGFVACMAGWYSFLTTAHFTFRQIEGFFGNRIVMALSCLLSLCVGVGLYRTATKPVERSLVAIACVPMLWMCLSPTSRGVAVATGCLALFVLARVIKSTVYFLPILVVAVGLLVLLSWDSIQNAYAYIAYARVNVYSAADVSSGRIYLYRAAIKLIGEHPILGIGWNRFMFEWYSAAPAPIVDARGIPRLNVHSSFLQVLVELGAVGLTIFLAWNYAYYRSARRSIDHFAAIPGQQYVATLLRSILFAIAGLMIHSLFDNEGRGINRSHLLLVGTIVVAEVIRRSHASSTVAGASDRAIVGVPASPSMAAKQ